MSPAPAPATFRSHERIRRREEFQRVYDRGTRIHSRFGTLIFLRTGLAVSRLGVAVTRKFGGAVIRNRAKRRIRDVFRRNKIGPGIDVVVIPKRALLEASPSTFEAEFRRLLERRPRL